MPIGSFTSITIVGLPYTGAAWRIAGFAFWPFGKEIVSREIVTGQHDLGTGPLGFLLNIVWFLLGGWYIALSHLMIAFAEAITIVGIPFAIKDFQLAMIALAALWLTPVLNAERISANSQFARFTTSGDPAVLDLWAIRQWGKAGDAVMADLEQAAPGNPALAAKLAGTDADPLQPTPDSAALRATLTAQMSDLLAPISKSTTRT